MLKNAIDFEFCLCLAVHSDLMELCNITSKYLQKKDMDISLASIQVESLIKEIKSYRNEAKFENI